MSTDPSIQKEGLDATSLAVLFLLASALMLKQLLVPGYYSVVTDDAITYTRWATQFAEALKEGVVYPRWMPHEFSNYGSPVFILYSPLPFYLVSLFNLFTGSITAAMNLVKFLSLFLTGLGLFLLVAEFFPRKTALFVAAFYICYPYNVLQYYLFGSFAATISFFWYPFILISVARFYRQRHYRYLFLAGICYGGLFLTYLINAYMFCYLLAALIVFISLSRKSAKDLLAFPVISAIGLLIAAVYLLPLICESKYLHLESFILQGDVHQYSSFFVLPNHTRTLPHAIFWRAYYDLFAQQVCVLFGITCYLWLKTASTMNSSSGDVARAPISSHFWGFLSFLSFLPLFGASTPIWEALPFFKYIQFPIRWLHIGVFSVALLAATFLDAGERTFASRKAYLAFLALIALTLATTDIYYIQRAHRFPEKELTAMFWARSPKEHLPAGVDLDFLRKERSIGGTAAFLAGQGKLSIKSWKSSEREIAVNATKEGTVRVGTFYFPGWAATIDNRETEIGAEEGSRAILVKMPEGNHKLKLSFTDTPARLYGKVISVMSLAFFLGAGFIGGRRKNNTTAIEDCQRRSMTFCEGYTDARSRENVPGGKLTGSQ